MLPKEVLTTEDFKLSIAGMGPYISTASISVKLFGRCAPSSAPPARCMCRIPHPGLSPCLLGLPRCSPMRMRKCQSNCQSFCQSTCQYAWCENSCSKAPRPESTLSASIGLPPGCNRATVEAGACSARRSFDVKVKCNLTAESDRRLHETYKSLEVYGRATEVVRQPAAIIPTHAVFPPLHAPPPPSSPRPSIHSHGAEADAPVPAARLTAV